MLELVSTVTQKLSMYSAKSDVLPSPQESVDTNRSENDTFWFLDLPAEVRNTIYKFVFSEQISIPLPIDLPRDPNPRHGLALLHVNRQLHAETSLLAHSLRTFSFNDPSMIGVWLGITKARQASAIQHLQLNTLVAPRFEGFWTKADFDWLSDFPAIKTVEFVVWRGRTSWTEHRRSTCNGGGGAAP
jgi:hypothetical protein